MTASALTGPASTAPLTVVIDWRQPQSYLALAGIRELATALGIAIDWQPGCSRPLSPPSPESAHEDRGTRHRRHRARYVEHDLRRYAAAQGLALGDLYRSPDPSLAGIGLLWLKKRADENGEHRAVEDYVDSVFAGYWREALDIEDVAAVRDVLESVGAPAAAFDPEALREEYDLLQLRLRAAGVIEAPAYLVGDDIFIGRAHVPMIRWLLTGRTGPPPI